MRNQGCHIKNTDLTTITKLHLIYIDYLITHFCFIYNYRSIVLSELLKVCILINV